MALKAVAISSQTRMAATALRGIFFFFRLSGRFIITMWEEEISILIYNETEKKNPALFNFLEKSHKF